MAEGVWQIVFVIFLAYAMMPLQIWEAAVFGVLLPLLHIGISVFKILTDSLQFLEYNQVNRNIHQSLRSFVFDDFMIFGNS